MLAPYLSRPTVCYSAGHGQWRERYSKAWDTYLDGVARLHVQGNGLARQGLNEDLHGRAGVLDGCEGESLAASGDRAGSGQVRMTATRHLARPPLGDECASAHCTGGLVRDIKPRLCLLRVLEVHIARESLRCSCGPFRKTGRIRSFLQREARASRLTYRPAGRLLHSSL
jgi:hypothetical protein